MSSNVVAGRGINDADYTVQKIKDGRYWHCPFYTAWTRMLRSKSPVSAEWIKFSQFRRWMSVRKWEGKLLDRWLYGDGDTYAPDKCCFIDRYCSNLAKGLRSGKTVGIDSPHGMDCTNPYRVSLHGDHIGYFPTLRDARKAWCDEARTRLRKRISNKKHRDAVEKLYGYSIKTLPN